MQQNIQETFYWSKPKTKMLTRINSVFLELQIGYSQSLYVYSIFLAPHNRKQHNGRNASRRRTQTLGFLTENEAPINAINYSLSVPLHPLHRRLHCAIIYCALTMRHAQNCSLTVHPHVNHQTPTTLRWGMQNILLRMYDMSLWRLKTVCLPAC